MMYHASVLQQTTRQARRTHGTGLVQCRTERIIHTFPDPLLEDGGRSTAGHAAGWVERVDAEQLVDEAAGDAKHGGAPVLALSIELERLRLLVVVAHPRDGSDVAGLAV